MINKKNQPLQIKPIDLIPAISGLIGKIALVSSFAVVFANAYGITNQDFVFQNVRIEILIASVITLAMAFILPDVSPPGTLAPLVVILPAMVDFGAHPFILSILVGLIGMVNVKTGFFKKLIDISGDLSKTSLSLVFGISGVILALKNLSGFFEGKDTVLFLLLILLAILYAVMLKFQKGWLIIPAAAVVSLALPVAFGMGINISAKAGLPVFSPSYWWNDLWGIGFGMNLATVIKTLPFALFVMLLWAVDTVSVNAVIDANFSEDEKKEEVNFDNSFLVVSVRNIIGGICGGTQTASIWRSFLIPLFMIKRPVKHAAVLLGLFGIISSIAAVPIQILSFPPLIWTVLLFGIFIPFIVVGIKNVFSQKRFARNILILVSSIAGLLFSPIFTWIIAVVYENFADRFYKKPPLFKQNKR